MARMNVEQETFTIALLYDLTEAQVFEKTSHLSLIIVVEFW